MWPLRRITRDIQAENQEHLSDFNCLYSLHLKTLQTRHLEISAGHSGDSDWAYSPLQMLLLLLFSLCFYSECMYFKLLQLCVTLCDPMDCSPPGSSVQGILQARILEWVVMPFSRGSSQQRDGTQSPVSPALQEDSLPLVLPGEALCFCRHVFY